MKYSEIKEWINFNLFDVKGGLNKTKCACNGKWVKENFKDVYNEIYQITSFLDIFYEKILFSQRLWHIVNDVLEVIRCKNCNQPVKFKMFSRGYPEFCDQKCYKKNPISAVEKIKQTKLERHGSENYNNMEKSKQTKKKRYGDENYNNIEGARITNKKRYGVDFFTKTNLFREKIKNYSHTLSSGKIINLQGYEPYVIELLLEDFHEESIISDSSKIPKFQYQYNDKWHTYVPDFFIPEENLIIEVKSTWTYKVNFEVNEIKRKSVIEEGYKFKFIVISYVSNSKMIIENVRSIRSELKNSRCK